MTFADRIQAGKQLAKALAAYKGRDAIVFALPRGGVPVAAEVARAIDAQLDLLLVRKIGAPMQPELAIGAVVDGANPIVVRNAELIEATGTTPAEFDAICARELAEIERRRKAYLAGRPLLDPAGRIAIIVDDGIATGATMRAGLRAVRQRKPAKLILAVPVAARDTLESMRGEADEAISVEMPSDLGAIGFFYRDFHQLGDQDVIDILRQFPAKTAPKSG